MHMFTEIYCMKYLEHCMQLLQYTGLLKNLSDKFPFYQVYADDKEFRSIIEFPYGKNLQVTQGECDTTPLFGRKVVSQPMR